MRLALYIIFLLWLWVQVASAATIDAVKSGMTADGIIQVLIEGQDIQGDRVNIFEIPGDDARIVVDFSDAKSQLLIDGAYRTDGIGDVRTIRGAVRDNGLRFVVDISHNAALETQTISSKSVLLLIKGNTQSVLPPEIAEVPLPSHWQGEIPIPRVKPAVRAKPVIAIDAGHGGKDPGALGASGLKEKSVTLKAALELKRQLLATGQYRVVMSRDSDRYIDHDDRIRIARVKSADLFISIHADATAGKSARGASVYTLADRAKNRSKGIVNSQNWIMDVNLSEQSDSVGNILVDLAQRNTLSQSTQFADVLIGKLGVSTELLRNTHRRAGYYVLLAPDVPAVLLEMGFISNPEDEKLLKTSQHRQKIMKSVVSAINTYFARQNP